MNVSYPALPRPILKTKRIVAELLQRLAFIAAIYVLINLISVRFVVDGFSMRPAFQTGQFLLVSRLDYLLGTPARGDIAVFHFPQNPQRDYIKRIIAIPGDTLEIRDAQVYINGQVINEPYLYEPCQAFSCMDGIWQLGHDQYFVMGDNRHQSSDSRAFGVVTYKHLIGKVIIRYWPLSDAGIISSYHYQEDT